MLRASIEVVNTWDVDGALVVRLLGAALLGGVVGAEREASGQPAGLRTHIAVALGAALFGAVSTLGFQEFDQARARTVLQADVSRVASNVAVGIGFLGAGVIFRQGDSIKNLTTAASLWVVAAVGLAAGVGNMSIAAIGTVTLVLSLVLLRPVRTIIRKRAPGRDDGGPNGDDD
jgi:putative Mg2+ transporter-C (MgtC) family protein